MAIITGTEGDDVDLWKLQGTNGADMIYGLGGGDEIVGGGGNDVLFGGADGDYLDGGAGIDTASYAGAASGVMAWLWEQGWTNDARYDFYTDIENLTGSDHDDYLIGNSGANVVKGGKGADEMNGGNGNDRLEGGDQNDGLQGGHGDDKLFGGAGADIVAGYFGRDEMTGGGGADHFHYFGLSESGVTDSTRDLITDFNHGQGDRIVLRAPAFEDFDFIGQAAFSAAGQIRFQHIGGDTRIAVNADADAAAEMQIMLTGHINVVDTDFIFLAAPMT